MNLVPYKNRRKLDKCSMDSESQLGDMMSSRLQQPYRALGRNEYLYKTHSKYHDKDSLHSEQQIRSVDLIWNKTMPRGYIIILKRYILHFIICSSFYLNYIANNKIYSCYIFCGMLSLLCVLVFIQTRRCVVPDFYILMQLELMYFTLNYIDKSLVNTYA